MAARNARVSRKPGQSRAGLTITQPNAAGIDIGSASHFVAAPPDRDDEPVREFPSFTVDLNALADWFAAWAVDTVAMESTGVYWMPANRPRARSAAGRAMRRSSICARSYSVRWACARASRSPAAR